MSIESLSSEDSVKLRKTIEEGVKYTSQVVDMRKAYREMVKAVAEELDMKPKEIYAAVTIAFKNNMDEHRETVENIENILAVIGKI